MMTLRMECIKYGNMKPVKTDSLDGHPKYHVDKNVLKSLLDCDFKISDIGNLKEIFLTLKMTKRIKVQRLRLRDAILRIYFAGTQERKTGRLHRRVCNVTAPNQLWHIDTNHKLNPVGTQLSERDLVDYGLEGNIDASNLMDDGRPIFEPMNIAINDQRIMRADYNRTGTNFGIDDFVNCVEILSAQA
ncbi:unnamed protein product [Mytilus edulis]|uniref:Uncharacterized protein n=1 Tax=Mytilus edulis TaxID=6550 RepID=A0A8S3QU67_MYTED|nr:unnamed protein product [Mytilus edulis]